MDEDLFLTGLIFIFCVSWFYVFTFFYFVQHFGQPVLLFVLFFVFLNVLMNNIISISLIEKQVSSYGPVQNQNISNPDFRV